MARSITAISKQLSQIENRITARKQSDLRECHGLAKSLLPVLRSYQKAKKSGFKREFVDKVDAAIEKALA
jgi:Mg2+ and Co2+ transporter CorA